MKRRKGGRASQPHKARITQAELDLLKGNLEAGGVDSYKVPFFVLVCAILVFGAYVLLPTKYTGPQNAETRERAPEESIFTSTGGILREELDAGLRCEQLMALAKELVDNKQPSEWDPALDLLATCALLEPHNSAPLWNLAVILFRMNHTDEALEFIDQALKLDPNNLEYLRTSGGFLAKLGMHSKVVRSLEGYLEAALRVPSWEHLLASISVQREDEWMFLYDAGEDVVDVFEMLLPSYLQEMSWIKAGYLYKVIIGLRGGDVDMNTIVMYSIFAFGLGDFVTGIKYLRRYTEMQYVRQGYGDSLQAYDVVTAHSLRLLTAGFDSQILSIGKNLLMAGDSVWEELVYNCELTPDNKFDYGMKLLLKDLQKIFLKCLRVQNIINSLVDDGAVVYAENLFGWSPLLHSAAIGGVNVLDNLLMAKADPQSRTVLAHTALHVAAMRGSFDITLPLTQAGLKTTEVDYFNRTALHIACLHGWSAQGMANALHLPLPRGCPIKPIYHPPPKLSMYGGWLPNSFTLPKALITERCDVDILTVPDVQTFVFDYLALQRPVLIRNATGVHSMKKLYQLYQRSKFKQEFGALIFNEVEVPYAESFGYNTTRKTSIKDFMGKMRLYQEDSRDMAIDSIPHPTYIFESLPPKSPLLNEFKTPAVLDEEITHISPLKTQFYLGPTLSGAPVHFHRNAWNLLIYGQKRWFLYPPDRAFYSKQHVWDWWKESYQKSPDALECVQYPGDLMFVPDMWGHAVINLREGVGMASEFIYGASEFSI